MSQSRRELAASVHPWDGRWLGLYRIGAVAALISIVIIPLSIISYLVWPPFPDDILAVMQRDKLAGLMSLDFLYLLGNVFAIPFFLVLYVTLKEVDESWALIALTLGLLGLVCLFLARPIPEMFALGDRYATATTEAEKVIYQADGEAILASFHGMEYHSHYILGSASLLISSFLMMRSGAFGRTAAYAGVVTNIVVFGLYVPEVGVYLSLLSVIGYAVWYILISRKLIQLGWGVSHAEAM